MPGLRYRPSPAVSPPAAFRHIVEGRHSDTRIPPLTPVTRHGELMWEKGALYSALPAFIEGRLSHRETGPRPRYATGGKL
jgi:hypothetical protein